MLDPVADTGCFAQKQAAPFLLWDPNMGASVPTQKDEAEISRMDSTILLSSGKIKDGFLKVGILMCSEDVLIHPVCFPKMLMLLGCVVKEK